MTRQQLIFLLIFFGMTVGSWVVGKLREQAKIRQARGSSRRQFEEQLRTGRPAEPARAVPSQAPSARESELAQRRQAQLRELRQQQEKRSSLSPRGPELVARSNPPTGLSFPSTQGRTLPGVKPGAPVRSAPVARARTTSAPNRAPTRTPPIIPGQVIVTPERTFDASTAMTARETSEPAERGAMIPPGDSYAQSRQARAAEDHSRGKPNAIDVRGILTGAAGVRSSPRDLRAIMALREVLGPPISLREG